MNMNMSTHATIYVYMYILWAQVNPKQFKTQDEKVYSKSSHHWSKYPAENTNVLSSQTNWTWLYTLTQTEKENENGTQVLFICQFIFAWAGILRATAKFKCNNRINNSIHGHSANKHSTFQEKREKKAWKKYGTGCFFFRQECR